MSRWWTRLIAVSVLVAVPAARAQTNPTEWTPTDTSVAKFVAIARATTERYRNQRAAIDDGYRKLGMDFPSMGEHWVSFEYTVAGVFAPQRPGILSYTQINGRPELVGAVYAIPLPHDVAPPRFPVGHEKAWHIHAGSIDEESLLLDHDALPHDTSHGPGEFRLAVLHVWAWADNPAGLFTTDNWSLPFRRLGFTPPSVLNGTTRDAARALSLTVGDGEDYYRRLFTAVAAPVGTTGSSAIATAVSGMRRSVTEWLHTRTGSGPQLGDAESVQLARLWGDGWQRVLANVPPDARARLATLERIWR